MKTAQEGRARGLNQSDREGVVCGGVARRGGKQIRGVAGVGGSVCVARRGCRSASLTSTPSAVTPPPTPTPPIAAICHHLAPLSPPPFSSGPDESASVLLGWLVSANVASCSEEVLQLLGGTACIFSLLPDFPEISPVCERAGRCCVACCVRPRGCFMAVLCAAAI